MAVERPFGVDHAVELDGTATTTLISDNSAVGIADIWTVGVWYKPDATALAKAQNGLFRLFNTVTGNKSGLFLSLDGINNRWNGVIFDSASTAIKQFVGVVGAALTQDVWAFIAMTWDGTNLQVYQNGVAEEGSLVIDLPGSQSDLPRSVFFGSDPAGVAVGKFYALGLWSSVLTSGEQLTLAQGAGHRTINEFFTDWRTNHGAYASAANLQHWYRPGFAANIGTDYGVAVSGAMPLIAGGSARPLIVKDSPVPDKSYGPEFSIKLPGLSGTELRSVEGTNSALGVANAWSVGVWYKPDATALAKADNGLFRVHSTVAGNPSSLILTWQGINNRWSNVIHDSASTAIKQFVGNQPSPVQQGKWGLHMMTWDGTDLLFYFNGLLQPGTLVIDNPGSMIDEPRSVFLGGQDDDTKLAAGRFFAWGLWDKALTSSEQLALYNIGDGQGGLFDTNRSDYVSAANLQHWYRPGFAGDLGADFGVAVSGLKPVTVSGADPGARIILRDAPVGPP